MFGHLLWQQSHQIQPIITCCSHCECYWQADERESLQATLNLFLSNSLRTHGLLHWTVNPCKGFTYMHAHIEHRDRNNLAKWLPCSISLLLKYKISSLKPKCKSVIFFYVLSNVFSSSFPLLLTSFSSHLPLSFTLASIHNPPLLFTLPQLFILPHPFPPFLPSLTPSFSNISLYFPFSPLHHLFSPFFSSIFFFHLPV